MASLKLTLLHTLIFYNVLSQTPYPFEAWMSLFPSSANFYDNTIFDIVLPGSRSAGMIYDTISSTPAIGTNNDFSYSRISSLSSDKQKLWSNRQHLSILNQLRSGSRFLAFEIEEYNNEYYSYNALLSSTNINSIINDIDTYITQYGTNEIILLYFNSFSNMNSASSFQQFYDIFTNSNIHSKMVPNTNNLSLYTLQNMIDNNYNIIAFSDEYYPILTNTPNTFFDANNILYIPKTSKTNTSETMNEISRVRTYITSTLRYGWPINKLNIIHWTLDIAPNGPFTQVIDYASFYYYNIPLSVELNTFIQTYPKLRFGNVILVDFIEASDVVEQTILLNYAYFQCSDIATDCPIQTSLATQFKYEYMSPICDPLNNNNLDTQCQRSCGLCSLLTNIPNSNCTSSNDCNSILYNVYGSGNYNGQCFIRSKSEEKYILKESFCLSISDGYNSCANYEGNDICNINNEDNYECDNYCSSDYQCMDGYCNTQYSICMTLNSYSITDNDNINNITTVLSDNKYNKVISDTADRYRVEVAVFRSGDPNAGYEFNDPNCSNAISYECISAMREANPYIDSVIGLILVMIIFSIIFCFCFSFCCPCWCCCDVCYKNCCCTPVYGKIEKKDWNSKYKEWGAIVALAIVLLIIFAFTIEGVVRNEKLHSHVFDASDGDSFVAVTDRVFDDIENKVNSIDNITDFVINTIEDTLKSIDKLISNNKQIDSIRNSINVMHNDLNIMHRNYSNGVELTGEVKNPFNLSFVKKNFSLHCAYCDEIPNKIIDINNTLADSTQSILDTINSTDLDSLDFMDKINDTTQDIADLINKTLKQINKVQQKFHEYMHIADDEYYSEPKLYVTLGFCILFIFIVIPIIGVYFKSKWVFKINWFLAMCFTVLLLIIAIPFAVVITLSADLCVRLDELENALPNVNNVKNTHLGKILFDNDILDLNGTNYAGYNINDTLELIDTCFEGGSVLSVVNVSNLLKDWNINDYKQELYESLSINIKQYLTVDELETFQTEINTLSIDEYYETVIDKINTLNSIPGCYCVDYGRIFSMNNLNPGTQCTPVGYTNGTSSMNAFKYWTNTSYVHLSECTNAFKSAAFAVQIWNNSAGDAVDKIETLKDDAQKLFDTFDVIYKDVNGLVTKLQNMTCLIEPIFIEFLTILNSFTNCGFLGERYGDLKRVACETLFTDFFYMGRAIVIIAFLLVLVVLCSLCVDYVYAPWTYIPPKPKKIKKKKPKKQKQKKMEELIKNNETNEVQIIGSTSPQEGDGEGAGETYTVPQTNNTEIIEDEYAVVPSENIEIELVEILPKEDEIENKIEIEIETENKIEIEIETDGKEIDISEENDIEIMEIMNEKSESKYETESDSDECKQKFRYFVVLDFKATCDKYLKISPQEIIEWSAMVIDSTNYEIFDSKHFHYYIKPKHNPTLTSYCSELYGISQILLDIKGGENTVKSVVGRWNEWCLKHHLLPKAKHKPNACIVTCGDWALKTMWSEVAEQQLLLKVDTPFEYRPAMFHSWINIKKVFKQCISKKHGKNMMTMLNHLGIEHEGIEDDGVDDVKNICKIVQAMLKKDIEFDYTTKGYGVSNDFNIKRVEKKKYVD